MRRAALASALGLLLLAGGAGRAFPQAVPDSAECATRLATPGSGSVNVKLGVAVAPFDTTVRVDSTTLALLREGMRETLSLPPSLALNVYVPSLDPVAIPTVRGVYRAYLHRDGRLSEARVVGGTRTGPLDDAVLRALAALDSSRLLPGWGGDAYGGADSIDLRWEIKPTNALINGEIQSPGLPQPVMTPFAETRMAGRRMTRPPSSDPGAKPPRYPEVLRASGKEGSVLVGFVIEPDGVANISTVEIFTASYEEFARAVIEALRTYRYEPMLIDGCPVASWEIQTFNFDLRH